MDRRSCNGFTLVELAVSMIIIGLLIGGVLKGQEMIHRGKINTVIKDLEGYNAAFHSFRDIYRGIPGDLSSATTRVKGCDSSSNCEDGNGNGHISSSAGGTVNPGWNTNISSWEEPFQAWKHLALADMITGVDSGAEISALSWAKSHPASPLGGGYEMYYDPSVSVTGSIDANSGHLIRITFNGITGDTIAANGSSALTPEEAYIIDNKIDNGNSYSGWVTIEDSGDVCVADSSGQYNLQNHSKDCILYFFLQ